MTAFYYCFSLSRLGGCAFWPMNDRWPVFLLPSEFAIGHFSYLASLPYTMAKMSLALKQMTNHQRADNLVSLLVLRSPKPEQARPKLAPFVLLPHIHCGPSRSAPQRSEDDSLLRRWSRVTSSSQYTWACSSFHTESPVAPQGKWSPCRWGAALACRFKWLLLEACAVLSRSPGWAGHLTRWVSTAFCHDFIHGSSLGTSPWGT